MIQDISRRSMLKVLAASTAWVTAPLLAVPEALWAPETLVQRIADMYEVLPQQSIQAYEDFRTAAGSTLRVTHMTFGFCQSAAQTPQVVDRLCRATFDQVQDKFPVGSRVVWRIRPYTAQEFRGTEAHQAAVEAWQAGFTDTPPGPPGDADPWTRLYMRLGCWACPNSEGEFVTRAFGQDHASFPRLKL